jgi:Tol biopolymer transport system component
MQVWIANADGTEAHPLTDGLYPAWSPDGKRLAYLLEDGIHTIAAEGGGKQTLLAPDGYFKTRPCWSPDGKWIYYESSRSGGLEIWRIPATADVGTKPTPVQMTKSGGIQAQVFEGFLYYRKHGVGTMRKPLAEGEEELMAPEGTAFTAMPGGIYVLRGTQLLLVDYRTRTARPIRQLDRAAGGSSIAISADEKYLVYSHESDAGNEIMLLGDLDWR